MNTYDSDEDKKLTAIQIANLQHISKRLLEMANMVFAEPFDPKIATHLKMASDLADEQVGFSKYYAYEDTDEESDYKLLDKDDTLNNEEVKEAKEKKKPVSEPPKTKYIDDDIHKWLDGLNGG